MQQTHPAMSLDTCNNNDSWLVCLFVVLQAGAADDAAAAAGQPWCAADSRGGSKAHNRGAWQYCRGSDKAVAAAAAALLLTCSHNRASYKSSSSM